MAICADTYLTMTNIQLHTYKTIQKTFQLHYTRANGQFYPSFKGNRYAHIHLSHHGLSYSNSYLGQYHRDIYSS